MIKIEKWFSDDICDWYFNSIVSKIKKSKRITSNGEIKFLPGYKIKLKTLFRGNKAEIMNVKGISSYIIMCRFLKISANANTPARLSSALEETKCAPNSS